MADDFVLCDFVDFTGVSFKYERRIIYKTKYFKRKSKIIGQVFFSLSCGEQSHTKEQQMRRFYEKKEAVYSIKKI